MRRVIFNQKGGVGKSSITANLAAISAARGRDTLVVDLDPQGNSSQYLLGDAWETVAERRGRVLQRRAVDPDPAARPAALPDPDRVRGPARAGLLARAHRAPGQARGAHKIYKLREAAETGRQFDAIYMDTPPAFNFYTLSALIAADAA
jgi:chromosome partitioning protein